MTEMRRTLLWVVFLSSIVFLYDGWNKHQGRPSLFSPAVPTAQVQSPAPAPSPSTAPLAFVPEAVSSAPRPEPVVVTTDVIKATLDPLGGDVIRLELLTHHDAQDRSLPTVLFERSAQRRYGAQSGLVDGAGQAPVPNFSTVMSVETGNFSLQPGQQQVKVRMTSPEVGGLVLSKVFTFERGSHVVNVQHEVINQGSVARQPQVYVQLVRDGNPPIGDSSFYPTYTGPSIYTEAGKFQKVEFKAIESHQPQDPALHETKANNGWVAIVQHYFASAWLLDNDQTMTREFFTRKLESNLYAVGMFLPLGELSPGAETSLNTRLFAGPQEETKLEKLAPGLELVKDYGIFTLLAKPLFWLLDKLNHFINNWGWSIVALVLILKIALYGLNAKAYKSMAKMKAITPKITEMRERLKDKPQEMQAEMLRIYREEKVNPLGGCLPVLLQMPIFMALYWVLLSSVEMRGAPWLGWITDLSVKDPYYILPLLMTATSLLTTWLNPRPADPMQAKMMWFMPLIFSVMFFFFPAGLVLYWLTNNILSIAQQYIINKRMGVLDL